MAAYLNITADTTAAAFGQNGGNCKIQYGSSTTCTVAVRPPPPPPGPRGRGPRAAEFRRRGPPGPPGPPPPTRSQASACLVRPNLL